MTLRQISDEVELATIKVRKLLITARVYRSDTADEVYKLYRDGVSVKQIQPRLGLSAASVNSYLPYTKAVYKAEECSALADRIRRYRARKAAVEKLKGKIDMENLDTHNSGTNNPGTNNPDTDNPDTDNSDTDNSDTDNSDRHDFDTLWECLTLFADYPFKTSKGLSFSYAIKGNEMFITRKEKSITRATVILAYKKSIALGDMVTGPKVLGVFGASYLYSVFRRIGVIRLPLLG